MLKLLKVKEVAEQLGLSEATIRAWILKKKIEYLKIGGVVRIKQEVVDKILKGE